MIIGAEAVKRLCGTELVAMGEGRSLDPPEGRAAGDQLVGFANWSCRGAETKEYGKRGSGSCLEGSLYTTYFNRRAGELNGLLINWVQPYRPCRVKMNARPHQCSESSTQLLRSTTTHATTLPFDHDRQIQATKT